MGLCMNRLALALVIITSSVSLCGMEMQDQLDLPVDKQSPITFAQTYHHFSGALLPEITQHIFSLQLGTADLADLPLNCKSPEPFVKYLEILIASCGYLLARELCECYLKHEKISLCDIKNENKQTCLHYTAKNPKVTEMLIKVAGDTASTLIAMQTTSGSTALHYAANYNNTENIKLILDAAGDTASTLIDMQDTSGYTALHYAASKNCTEIVKLLLDTAGNTASTLIAMQNKIGWTALHYAANKNRTEIVTLILNAAGDTASTLLPMQNTSVETALHRAACYNCIEIVKLILDAAGNTASTLIIMRGVGGWTALHRAASNNYIEIVKLILDAAGDASTLITMKDEGDSTALDYGNQETKEVMKKYMAINQ
jgi:ankyrin repeat protein